MTFHRLLNNKYIFGRVVYYVHEGHHLYACKFRNSEIDDALWLTKTGSFNIIRNKLKLCAGITSDPEYPLLYWPAKSLSILFEQKHYDIIRTLFKVRSATSLKYCFLTTEVIDSAIQSEVPIALLEEVEVVFPQAITWKAFTSAAGCGRLDVIEWLRAKLPGVKPSGSAVDNAALNGHLHIIKYFHESGNWAMFSSRTLDAAVKSGNFELVEFLMKNRKEGVSHQTIDLMTADSQFHDMAEALILSFITPISSVSSKMGKKDSNSKLDQQRVPCSCKALVGAAKHGNLKLLKLLIENDKFLGSKGIASVLQSDVGNTTSNGGSSLVVALQYCHIECFDYLATKVPLYNNSIKYLLYIGFKFIFNDSPSHESEIALVDYLISNNYTLDKNILSRVAGRGNVELFKQLVLRFGYDIPQIDYSIQDAVERGKVDMVLHLYDVYGKDSDFETHMVYGITSEIRKDPKLLIAMLEGIHKISGRLPKLTSEEVIMVANTSEPMLRYLYEAYQEQDINFILPASRYGCLDIVEKSKKTNLAQAYEMAVAGGHLNIIMYLTDNFHAKASKESMIVALESGNVELASYLYNNRYTFLMEDIAINCPTMQNNYFLLEKMLEKTNKTGRPLKGVENIEIYDAKDLTTLKLLTSNYYTPECLGFRKILINQCYSRMVTFNRLDLVVYVIEELAKFKFFETYIGISTADNLALQALYHGLDEMLNYFVDKMKEKYPKDFPRALYNRLIKGVEDDSRETNDNYRLFIHFKKRLNEEIFPTLKE